MVLEFRPPYPIDPNAESPELQSLNRINQALGNIAQSAQTWGQESREQAYKKMLMDLAKAKEAREAQEAESKLLERQGEWGTPAATSYQWTGGMPATPAALVPQFGPQLPSPGVSPAPPPASGMVERFRQWQTQRRAGEPGAGPPNAGFFPRPQEEYRQTAPEVPGYSYEQVLGVGGGGQSKLGTKQLAELKALYPQSKPADTTTPLFYKSDLLKNRPGSFPKGAQIIDDTALQRAGEGQEFKETMGLEKAYSDIERRANPALAPRGSPLGLAGVNNQRADRALAVLTNPNATDQQLMAGVVDLAAIMHGGAPDEMEVKNQMYGTLQGRWNRLITYVTSKPVAARQPEVQEKIRQLIRDVKEVDNKVIGDNLDSIEVSRQWMIGQDPKRWQKYRSRIMQTTEGLPGATTPSPDFGPGAGGAQAFTADILSYAQRYGISPARAAAIKAARMGGRP